MKKHSFLYLLLLVLPIQAQQRVDLLRLEPNSLESRLKGKELNLCDSLVMSGSVCPEEFISISKCFPNVKYIDTKGLEFVKCDNFVDMYPQRYKFPASAFRQHQTLETVILPDSIKVVDKEAFMDCPKLKEVVYPVGIEQILDGAFSGCPELTVSIPSTVYNLGRCFSHCTVEVLQLPDNMVYYSPIAVTKDYLLSEKNSRFLVEEGVLYSKDKQTLLSVPTHKKDYQIPSTVRFIAGEAFRGNTISKTVIPDSIQEIRSGAFCMSQGLVELVFPNNQYLKLGNHLFSGSKQPIAVICQSAIPYANWHEAFKTAPKGTIFYVPKGNLAEYVKQPWAKYYRIEEYRSR